jgi:hypothetical protein
MASPHPTKPGNEHGRNRPAIPRSACPLFQEHAMNALLHDLVKFLSDESGPTAVE